MLKKNVVLAKWARSAEFFKAYLWSANPNSSSVAGGFGKDSDYPVYGCQGDKELPCIWTNYVKNKNPKDINIP